MSYKIENIPMMSVPNFWPRAKEILSPAIDSEDELVQELITGNGTLIRITNGIELGYVVVTVGKHVNDRILCVLAMAGTDFPKWYHALDEHLLAMAKERGCVLIEFVTRRRSQFLIVSQGFEDCGTIFRKRVP